jgi:hypothetical protein
VCCVTITHFDNLAVNPQFDGCCLLLRYFFFLRSFLHNFKYSCTVNTNKKLTKHCLKINFLLFQIKGRDVGFQTTKEGEFWRILLPGIYTMEVFAEGYQPRELQFAIVEQNPTLLNITLFDEINNNRYATLTLL